MRVNTLEREAWARGWFWIIIFGWLICGLAAVAAAEPLEIKPGTLCPDGLKYETVWVEDRFTAICYEGDVDEARAQVGADESRPSFTKKEGECMTCFEGISRGELEIILRLEGLRRDR